MKRAASRNEQGRAFHCADLHVGMEGGHGSRVQLVFDPSVDGEPVAIGGLHAICDGLSISAVAYDRMVPPKTFKEYRTWLAKQVRKKTIDYTRSEPCPRDEVTLVSGEAGPDRTRPTWRSATSPTLSSR